MYPTEELIFQSNTQRLASSAWLSLKSRSDMQHPTETRQLCFVAMLGLFETYTILKISYKELYYFNGKGFK